MPARNPSPVLAYQCARERRRESRERFWSGWSEVVAYSVVWGAVGAVAAAAVGTVVLWGVLLASAAH
jgi:hypothetical protein